MTRDLIATMIFLACVPASVWLVIDATTRASCEASKIRDTFLICQVVAGYSLAAYSLGRAALMWVR